MIQISDVLTAFALKEVIMKQSVPALLTTSYKMMERRAKVKELFRVNRVPKSGC